MQIGKLATGIGNAFKEMTWALTPGSGAVDCMMQSCSLAGAALAATDFIPGGKVANGAGWALGAFKSEAKWAGQLEKRGWTTDQISEAIATNKSFPAENLVNKGNPAERFVHPSSGQSVVIDTVTKEVIHVGGPGFKY